MKSYRVGIIGCGSIANAHARGYRALGLNIAAAADINQEKLNMFKERYGVKNLYKDYKQMLHKEALDILSVCTWPPLHSEMTVAAAEAGVKGVLCEKPMATCLAEADRMIEACEKTGAKLAVGHMRRFSEIYVKARRLVVDKVVGEPTFIHGISVGDLLSDGTHLVDIVRFFAGDQPVNWVIGQIDAHEKRRRYGHYVEDAAICYIEFRNGLTAFIEMSAFTKAPLKTGTVGFSKESLPKDLARAQSIYARRKAKYCSVYIQGTEGRIEVGERERPPLRFKGKGDADWNVPQLRWDVDPFKLEIEALIESIEQGKENPCSGKQGRQTLEVLMAVFESSRRREIIPFPLEVMDHPLTTMIEKGEI